MKLQPTLTLIITSLCLSAVVPFSTLPQKKALGTTLFSSTTSSDAVTSRFCDFEGHKYYSEVIKSEESSFLAKPKPDVILIHGFGLSGFLWRETKKYLSDAGYTVHALDLLGLGKSDKPGRAQGIEYSTDLWAALVDSYAQAYISKDNGIVLMGNSLGGPICLAAASGDFNTSSGTDPYIASRVRGVGLYNCGIGMNSIGIIRDPSWNPIQKVLLTSTFNLLNSLVFGNVSLITFVLDKVVTKELLENALLGLYKFSDDPTSRVDDALVESVYIPAKEPSAVDVLTQIYTNEPGKTPMEFHEDNKKLNELPINLVWGDGDPVTPIEGSVGQFYTSLAQDPNSNVSLNMINGGHIPFDEIPECNEYMVSWLEEVVMQTGQAPSRPLFQWPFGQ